MAKTALQTLLAEKRATAFSAATAILDAAETQKRDLTVDEQRQYAALSADISAIGQRAAQMAKNEDENRQAESILSQFGLNGGDSSSSAFGAPSDSWLPGRRAFSDMVAEQRATGFSNAGAVLPTTQFGQWFDRLRSASVLLKAGPRLLQVPSHALSVPVLTGSATVASYNENSVIGASDPQLAAVVLTPVKFGALVMTSNESLADSNPALLDILSTDLLRSTATQVDVDLLAGPGTTVPTRVRGLRNIAGVTSDASLGANGAVPTLDTLFNSITSLQGLGSNLSDLAVFLTPAVWAVLRKTKDSTGRYIFQPDVTSAAASTAFGVRVFPTGNLPQTETLGTSAGVCSSIIVADMSHIIVGVGQDVSIQQSEDFAFNANQTAVRVTARFDINTLNANAIIVTPGAKTS